MRPRVSILAAVVLGLSVATGVAGPAEAAGGPPTITVTPSPVTPDGTLTVTGTGCDAGSPVSFRVWETTLGGYGYWHSTNTGWTADGDGSFSKGLHFEPPFTPTPGAQIGVAASCTSTHDLAQESPGKFLLVTLADPTVSLSVPAAVAYGAPVRVTVTPSRATGVVTLKLDGATVNTNGSAWGAYTVTLPVAPALGRHALEAVFDPTVVGAPTVTDTATFTVAKATAKVTLDAGKKKVRKGKKVKVTVQLTSTGPATGRVHIKHGAKVRKTMTLTAADAGVKRIKVRLPKTGKRKLTAHFAGNGYVTAAKSGEVRVKVVR